MKTERAKRSLIWLTPIEEFKDIIKNSKTIREVIEKTGMVFSTSHYKTFHARVKEESIDISHFDALADRKPSMIAFPLSEVMVENSSYNRRSLKKRLIKDGLLKDECALCPVGNNWNGKPLSLHLDHINGVNDDNRIENLRLLCPNCHSQTETFGAKNIFFGEKKKCKKCSGKVNKKAKSGLCITCHGLTQRRVERPKYEILKKQVEELGYVKTGKFYGVSDNAIRKWVKDYNQAEEAH